MDKSIDNVITEAASFLKKNGNDSPKLEARMLLASVLNLLPSDILFLHRDLIPQEEERFNQLLKRRLQGEPVCKILGYKDFYKYRFFVNNHVLSPRADTEVLVEAAVSFAKTILQPKMIDFGTGSGCILLSLLADVPTASGVGVDISLPALEISNKNAVSLGVQDRCTFINGSWFDADITEKTGGDFDIIVTNPPYIPSAEIADLQIEVRNYDPLGALDGGEDGFLHYRKLAALAPKLLKKDGRIFIEAGIHQDKQIAQLFEDAGLQYVETLADLQAIGRCVILKK